MSQETVQKSTQLTYWIPTWIEEKIREDSIKFQTNRQGVMTHILTMYYKTKDKLDEDASALV